MNLSPMSDVDYLCYGDVVVVPDGYFAAYEAVTKHTSDGKQQESQEQQSPEAVWLMLAS